jgi:hypothetical protein
MKKLFSLALFGVAALIWTAGLGLALRAESGLPSIALIAAAFAMEFGPSLVQGRFREEFRIVVPSVWVRRYLVLFAFFVFAVPGLMNFVSPWTVVEGIGGHPVYGEPSENWGFAILFALFFPAAILVGWAQSSRPTADPQPNPS